MITFDSGQTWPESTDVIIVQHLTGSGTTGGTIIPISSQTTVIVAHRVDASNYALNLGAGGGGVGNIVEVYPDNGGPVTVFNTVGGFVDGATSMVVAVGAIFRCTYSGWSRSGS